MSGLLVTFVQMSILRIRIHPGSKLRTDTQIVLFVNNSRRSAISPQSLSEKLNSSLGDSITALENVLASNRRIRYSSINHLLSHLVDDSKTINYSGIHKKSKDHNSGKLSKTSLISPSLTRKLYNFMSSTQYKNDPSGDQKAWSTSPLEISR